jgi:hypothetical protein
MRNEALNKVLRLTGSHRLASFIGIGLLTLLFISAAILFSSDIAYAGGSCNVGSPSGNDNTSQIQSAIDQCTSQGGGEVILTSGKTYTTGTLQLKNNVTLNLNNATIQASDDEGDFHSLKCPGCHAFFIGTSSGTHDIAIIGPGTISRPSTSTTYAAMVEFWDSSYILVQDIVIDTSSAPSAANGFHLVSGASDHVTFDGVTIRGGRRSNQSWGNDGMDLQSSQHVVVRNCDIDTHDDGIAIASSSGSGEKNDDIFIENCRVASDSAALKFGTGSEYDIQNITYENITLHDSPYGIRFSIYDGAEVSNITFRKITFESSVDRMVVCGGGTDAGKNVYDCQASVDRDGDGHKETPGGYIHDIIFEDLDLYGGGKVDTGGHHQASINNMERVTFKNIRYYGSSGSAPLAWFRDICGLSISGFSSHLSGDPNQDLRIDSSVTNLRFDGSPPSCGGVAPPPPTPLPTPAPTPAPTPSPTFVDVPFSHWAHDYIEALYQRGYTSGCSTDPLMYCPEETMDRAESAVFVVRGVQGANYSPPQPSQMTFSDVPLSEWYAKWADDLWENGYTAGCGTNPLTYCPMQEHTRTEGTVFFLRMMHGASYVPPDPVGIFSDVSINDWGAKWVEAAYNAGLIPACETSPTLQFCPDDPLDRATAAFMMVQAKGLNAQ